MSRNPVDGRLGDWDSISHRYSHALLTGNGASLAVWPLFSYASLYDEADLTPRDERLFTRLETQNFESVLDALRIARVACRGAGHETRSIWNQYRRIRRALVRTVASVHVPWDRIKVSSVQIMRAGLRHFDYVFSTNYDLLHYWTLMSRPRGSGFVDFIWGDNHSFDSTNTVALGARTKILYLHGALHLYRDSEGVTRKRVAAGRNLLSAFAQSTDVPVFVSEGRSSDKEAAIRRDPYLSFAYETFSRECDSLVVFGHALRGHDAHLRRVIRRSCRRLAVALLPGKRTSVREKQARIVSAFPDARLDFFDATTHPLGDPALALTP